MEFKNILALAPHTDDIEIGCGGTLNRFKDSNILVAAFSYAPPVIDGDIKGDFEKAMNMIGAEYECLGLEGRTFYSNRQQILDYLWKLNKKIKFDLVFCPSSFDNHQDHEVIRNEAGRIFKHTTMLGYEMPWNNKEFRTDTFVKLTKEDIDFKVEMLNCYKSQKERDMFAYKDYAIHLAQLRGLQVKSEYAEAFETIKCVI